MIAKGLVSSTFKEKCSFFTMLLVAVTLPLSIKLNSIAIILLVVGWIYSGEYVIKLNNLRKNKIGIVFILFYLYTLMSFIWGSPSRDWSFDLEKKLTIILMPVIFASLPLLERNKFELILRAFAASCLIASLICFVSALYHFSYGDPSYFFYHKLGSALNFHAVYFSLYISFSFIILADYTLKNWNDLSLILKVILFIIKLFWICFLILLSSKIILVTFGILFVIFLVYLTVQKHLRGHNMLVILLFISFVGSMTIYFSKVGERFSEVLNDEHRQDNPLFVDDYQGYHFTGGTIRLAIWKTCVEILNDERAWILGVGPGKAQSKLTAAYKRKHFYPGDSQHIGFLDYNAHNQYFQFLISLGLVGTGWFILLLAFSILYALRNKDLVLFSCVWLFAIFSLTESTLQVQKGIVFFSFFLSLLLVNQFSKEGPIDFY